MANSISKIKIPSGTVYEVKDDTSRGGITDLRSKIDNLNSVVGASIERREGSATSTYGGTVTILSGIRLKANGAYKMTATLNRSISDQPVVVELKKSDGTVYQSVTIPVGETTTESAMFGNIGNTDLENCYVTFRNPSGLVNSLTCTVVIDTAVAKPVDNISKKLDKPSTDGTAGQVVASNGNGGTEWVNMVEVSAEATQLPEGSSPTVTSTLVSGVPTLTFGIPAGATGATGEKGGRGDTVIIAKDYADLTFPVYAGKTYCYYDNKPYVANTDIATTEAWTAAHWDEVSFEDEIGDLKSAINQLPSAMESDAEDVDLDITDSDGNVIARFANGHIMTKEFDSSNIPTGSNERTDVKWSNSTADLVITDSNGNVIAQFENGSFRTKHFNSEDTNASLTKAHKALDEDYYTEFTYDNSSSSTVTVTGDFKQGDTILCHFSNMANNRKDASSNYKATYYYVDANNFQQELGKDYPYNFPRFTLPTDCSQIVALFPAYLIETGTYTCRFIVYKVGEFERQPHIVTVSPDGSKDYTSIRDAMDSITDNNAYNTYEIWVYPGTYNILEDYTDEEITESGFKGLYVNNGVSIVGIGHRESIILHGELDPDDYDRATVRNNISTLNMSGNSGLKNLTVTNRYLRYAVHDDTSSATYQEQTRIIENCVFESRDAASGGPGEAAYGAGGAANKVLIIKDCDLGERLIIHNGDNFILPMTAIVQNSTVKIVTLTDCLLSSTYKAPTRVEFDNCNIGVIRHMLSSGHTEPSMLLCGTGTHDVMIDIAEGILYNFGDCVKFPGTISAGQVVAVNNQMQIEATTNRLLIYGISIGNDGTDTYVQTRGFINSNTVGLTGLSAGDYVTINSNGVLTATNATESNAVGVVTALSAYSSSAYIKLLI